MNEKTGACFGRAVIRPPAHAPYSSHRGGNFVASNGQSDTPADREDTLQKQSLGVLIASANGLAAARAPLDQVKEGRRCIKHRSVSVNRPSLDFPTALVSKEMRPMFSHQNASQKHF